MSRFGEPVPYDATAVRPGYADLPASVQVRIEKELGGSPIEVRSAGSGFTGGFAATVRTDSGGELFVKAAGPDKPFVIGAYRQEARINPALPTGVPAPRLEFAAEVDEWIVLGLEVVRGKAPTLPMTTEELEVMLRAWAEAAEALTPAPRALLDLGVEAAPIDESLRQFGAVAAGTIDPYPVPPRLEGHLDELAALESNIEEALRADSVMHFDLRPDNMIVGADRAWICDWNWLQVHATWFDTACFLVSAHGDGHDADRLFWEHPTAADVTDEQFDTGLTAIAGYYLSMATKPPIDGVSPYLRAHQKWSGLAAADWLANRRGW